MSRLFLSRKQFLCKIICSSSNFLFVGNNLMFIIRSLLGCPTTYSCHVASVHFYSQLEAERSGYRDTRCGYFRIRYSSITRRTWLFRIWFEDIREYLVTQAMGHKASSKRALTVLSECARSAVRLTGCCWQKRQLACESLGGATHALASRSYVNVYHHRCWNETEGEGHYSLCFSIAI